MINKMNKQIDSRFDILKFLMAIMIVALHSQFLPNLLMPWLRIAVSMFFILSSYFFFLKINATNDQKEKQAMLSHFIKRSSLLYLFWFTVMFLPTIFIRKYFENSILDGIIKLIHDLFFGSTFVASWFIQANIIATYIIFKAKNWKITICILSLVLYVICCITTNYYFAFPKWNDLLHEAFPRYNCCFSFPAALLWVYMGAHFASIKHFEKIRLWTTLLVLGCILLFFENQMCTYFQWTGGGNDNYFSLIIICPSLFMLIQCLPMVHIPYSLTLRRASIIFYCTHGTITRCLSYYFKTHISNYGIQTGSITFLITLILCTSITIFILAFSNKPKWDWMKYSY